MTVRHARTSRPCLASTSLLPKESREGATFAESVIKTLTGGDTIWARRLHENGFEFCPKFKIWLATNHKPTIRGTDIGIWSRVRLIPFTVSFEGCENKTLKQELPGILSWLLEGCLEWQREGLGSSRSVRQANSEYQNECDQLQRFFEDCCVLVPRCTVKSREIYAAYQKWCQQIGEQPVTQTAFGRRMADRGYQSKHTANGNRYEGLGLREEDQKGEQNGQ